MRSAFDGARYTVDVDGGGGTVALKPGNLTVVPPPPKRSYNASL